MQNLEQLFVEQLQDIYDAETQLLEALPKMAQAATSQKLKTLFEDHIKKTEKQKQRLEAVFKELDEKPKTKTCQAMKGLLKEAEEILKQQKDSESSVLDAALIGASQKVEHYEIATYGTLRTWAQQLGYSNAAIKLEDTLNEEYEADKGLTLCAERVINPRAAEE
ncbi:YciE/YciF ferroxidase family protein [Deinococcus roseus]|uniref:YciE/YciF family protein n=1 Tax=Deinococcus roseus TaxID=392414 RepID=A0ABQ2D364_9DEIO|nr:ferritin-like domain-containing protein [Deinococcus roseus]GGJ39369.1 YciE/YciF family protein [Deinococcus roseus]